MSVQQHSFVELIIQDFKHPQTNQVDSYRTIAAGAALVAFYATLDKEPRKKVAELYGTLMHIITKQTGFAVEHELKGFKPNMSHEEEMFCFTATCEKALEFISKNSFALDNGEEPASQQEHLELGSNYVTQQYLAYLGTFMVSNMEHFSLKTAVTMFLHLCAKYTETLLNQGD